MSPLPKWWRSPWYYNRKQLKGLRTVIWTMAWSNCGSREVSLSDGASAFCIDGAKLVWTQRASTIRPICRYDGSWVDQTKMGIVLFFGYFQNTSKQTALKIDDIGLFEALTKLATQVLLLCGLKLENALWIDWMWAAVPFLIDNRPNGMSGARNDRTNRPNLKAKRTEVSNNVVITIVCRGGNGRSQRPVLKVNYS